VLARGRRYYERGRWCDDVMTGALVQGGEGRTVTRISVTRISIVTTVVGCAENRTEAAPGEELITVLDHLHKGY
jgi:hypothetical protein